MPSGVGGPHPGSLRSFAVPFQGATGGGPADKRFCPSRGYDHASDGAA